MQPPVVASVPSVSHTVQRAPHQIFLIHQHLFTPELQGPHMVGTTPPGARFEEMLFNSLASLDQDVLREYKVGGTNFRLDGYIASFPRTVIEAKVSAHGKMLNRDIKNWRNRMMHSLIPDHDLFIYVVLSEIEPNVRENIVLEAREAGVTLLIYPYLQSDNEMQKSANDAAKKIKDIRSQKLIPKSIEVSKFLIPKYIERNVQVNQELINSIKQNGVIDPIMVIQNKEGEYDVIDGGQRVIAAKKLGLIKIPAVQIDASLGSFWENDEKNIRKELGQDLKALMNLIDDGKVRDVIDHEFTQLCREFEEEHFTSCGLRVGRLLELLIYGLAYSWSVSLNEPRLDGLQIIESRTSEIKSAFLDYCDVTEENEKKKKIIFIQKQLNAINNELMNLRVEVSTVKPEDLKSIPRNTGAILRDIYSKFKKIEIVRDQFAGKGLENKVHKIMIIRHSAAHADINLSKRELSSDEVLTMIGKIRELMFKLTTIGHAIQNHLD